MKPPLRSATERRIRAKRIFDTALVVFGMVPALVAVVLCMLAIRLSSPGPALFRQTRIGLRMQPFTCYKLRTMYLETPSAPSHETAVSAVTPIGRWLRILKIDELPQLWNVLRGDMSLVGPRPCLPSQTDLIRARDIRGIYDVRPGITGLSQVTGIDMSHSERLAESDARYLADMSLRLDITILLATVFGAGRKDRVKSQPDA